MQSYYHQDLNMALDFSILAPVYLYGQTNLISVETHKAETQIKLDKEIKMGRVLGLFIEKPLHNFWISFRAWNKLFFIIPLLPVQWKHIKEGWNCLIILGKNLAWKIFRLFHYKNLFFYFSLIQKWTVIFYSQLLPCRVEFSQ